MRLATCVLGLLFLLTFGGCVTSMRASMSSTDVFASRSPVEGKVEIVIQDFGLRR